MHSIALATVRLGSTRLWSMVTAMVAFAAYAPAPASAQTDETASGHLGFEFMIGTWQIDFRSYDLDTGEVSSVLDAVQEVTYLNGTAIIVDEWTGFSRETGEEISYGVTLRSYSPTTREWQHTFLQSGQAGPASAFSGSWREGEMRAEGSESLDDGREMRFRLKFYDIAATSFKWMEEWSIDDGLTWHLSKTQVAQRIK